MKKHILSIIQIVLMLLWAVLLLGSDAFPAVFLFTAIFAVAAIILNNYSEYKVKEDIDNGSAEAIGNSVIAQSTEVENISAENKEARLRALRDGCYVSNGQASNRKHRPVLIIVSAILSAAVVCGNYGLIGSYTENRVLQLFGFLVLFTGGMCVFSQILAWMIRLAERTGDDVRMRGNKHRLSANAVFFGAAGIYAFVYLLILFIGFYPGIISPDSVNQIEQTFTGVYSNHHPFWHTMIIKACLNLGISIWGDINAGVCIYSVFQIICMAFSFAYIIRTLYKLKMPYGFIIPVFLFFMLTPYHILYSFTMWKDVLFGAAMAVFLTSLLKIMVFKRREAEGMIPENGAKENKISLSCSPADMIILIISGLGVCLLRSNGQIAFAVTFVVAVFVLGKRYLRVILALAAVLAISVILKYPVLSALHVTQPDTIESLSIPSQQIARIIADGGELTEDERELLSNVVDVDRIAETYRWYTSDFIKDLVREKDNQDYITAHRMDFIRLYLKLGLKHPVGFVTGWIDATKGYYNGGYGIWNWVIVNDNDRGIERHALSEGFADAVHSYSESYNHIWPLQPFVSIGLFVWVTTLLFAAAIATRKKTALLMVPLLAMVLTLLIATPVYAEFRYAYALFTCMPVMLAGVFHRVHN